MVEASDFSAEASVRDQIIFLLNYAVMAPSSHNTQPWKFTIDERTVELYRDRDRWLEVADSDQRELHLSLGCALENLFIAAAHYGLEPEVTYDNATGDRVASLTLGETTDTPPTGTEERFRVLKKRRTHHDPFNSQGIEGGQRESLQSVLGEEGVEITWIEDPNEIDTLAEWHQEADRRLFRDPAFREELGLWIGRGAFGDGWLKAKVSKLAVTYFDIGERMASQDGDLIKSAPLVGLLHTQNLNRSTQLRTGRLAERIWLEATALGLGVQPISASLEVDELKQELAEAFDVDHPQHLFRVGWPTTDEAPPPRRPVREVLL